VEGLEAHFLQEFGEFFLGSDVVEVEAVGVPLQDASPQRLLLHLPDPLPLLAQHSQLFVRPSPRSPRALFHY
jgi:hypothetical protein